MAYPIKYIENNLVFNHDGECFAYYELLPYNYSFLSPEQKYQVHDSFRQLIAQNMNRKKTVPKRLMVFVMVRLVFSLSSISSTTISYLSCPMFSSGLVELRLSTRSLPMLSTSELPYCSRSHGCLT